MKHAQFMREAHELLVRYPTVELRHISSAGLTSHMSARSISGADDIVKRVWSGNERADALAKGL